MVTGAAFHAVLMLVGMIGASSCRNSFSAETKGSREFSGTLGFDFSLKRVSSLGLITAGQAALLCTGKFAEVAAGSGEGKGVLCLG